VYLFRAARAEQQILAARRPLAEMVLDSTVDPATRGTLTLVMEAREFARTELGLDVGDSYTSFTELESDTLALVLSGAWPDRLAPVTWWFPVVGHLPYRGFFSLEGAEAEQARLRASGYDTYLRPTAAFSTLGWFSDPLLSTIVQGDVVETVTTVLHELSHNHLFVPGQVTFNESYATFVGRAGAADFFCNRPGGGPDTVWCLRARARWRDTQRFSRFMGSFVPELRAIYDDPDLSTEEKVARRDALFARTLEDFDTRVTPTFESLTFAGFRTVPLNNATLLSRIRYYNDLEGFQRLRDRTGGTAAAVAFLSERARQVEDPFTLLPPTSP
jgi:predicted aminopeptidase